MINGYLMSGDVTVGLIKDNIIEPVQPHLLPLFFKERALYIDGWLASRAIDKHRPNSRLLKKALRLTQKDDVSTVMNVHAVTITDNYWVKPIGSQLSYEDVKFHENFFDTLALTGDINSFSYARPSRTPELTNTGSYEKCWRLEDETWWMYKSGNTEELFSEFFIYLLGNSMGYNMATYQLTEDHKYIKTKDFTGGKINYEPAESLCFDNDDYAFNYHKFKQIRQDIADDYLSMLVLDTLCSNMDRHTQNYGLLRNQSTGEILGLAPNFDNNIALIARGFLSPSHQQDGLYRYFEEFVKTENIYFDLPSCTERHVESILTSIPLDVDKKFVYSFILSRYNKLHSLQQEIARKI